MRWIVFSNSFLSNVDPPVREDDATAPIDDAIWWIRDNQLDDDDNQLRVSPPELLLLEASRMSPPGGSAIDHGVSSTYGVIRAVADENFHI